MSTLLLAADKSIACMAASVLFSYCTPSSSMAFASSDHEWKENTEVYFQCFIVMVDNCFSH